MQDADRGDAQGRPVLARREVAGALTIADSGGVGAGVTRGVALSPVRALAVEAEDDEHRREGSRTRAMIQKTSAAVGTRRPYRRHPMVRRRIRSSSLRGVPRPSVLLVTSHSEPSGATATVRSRPRSPSRRGSACPPACR